MALDVFFPGRLPLFAVLIIGEIWCITSLQVDQGNKKQKKNAKANTKRSLQMIQINQSPPALITARPRHYMRTTADGGL